MTQKATEIPEETPAKTRLRLWLRLLKVTRMIEGELRENLRTKFETTLPRFDVMAALYQYPKGLRMSELSGVLKVSNGNVTGIIDRLVKDGSVLRVPIPGDRRALLVRLTKRGEDEFLSQAEEHEEWVNTLLSDVSKDDAEQIISSIDAVSSTTKADEK